MAMSPIRRERVLEILSQRPETAFEGCEQTDRVFSAWLVDYPEPKAMRLAYRLYDLDRWLDNELYHDAVFRVRADILNDLAGLLLAGTGKKPQAGRLKQCEINFHELNKHLTLLERARRPRRSNRLTI